jgi:hypothetical protein
MVLLFLAASYMSWLFTQMLIGPAVQILVAPLLDIVCSLVITFYLGLLSANTPSRALVLKPNTEVLLMLWLRHAGFANSWGKLRRPLARATLVYWDNTSAVYLSTNLVHHQRTKHVEIDLHFVRDCVALGAVCVLHVPTSLQYADIFIKGLPTAVFINLRSSLNVRFSPG